MPTQSPFLTPEEVAAFLRVPLETLKDWRKRHYGPPYIHVGRAVRYPQAELAAWLRSQRQLVKR